MSYYNIGHRSKKWWKHVFSYLVEVCALNAYLFSGRKDRLPNVKENDYYTFRLVLARTLIGNYSCRSCPGRPQVLMKEDVLPFYDESHKHLAANRLRCVVCSAKGERHESKVTCVDCNVHLCLTEHRDCYSIYHTKFPREW